MTRYIFNPQHDMCLASGEENFIPPAPVQEFARKCRWIEEYMPSMERYPYPVMPWGWNSSIKKTLLKEGYSKEELPPDSSLDFIREHSRRELAVELLDALQGGSVIPSKYRTVAHSMEEIETFLQEKGRVVLKAPLSGSGKGVRFVSGELMETDSGWCKRILQRQGAVIVEERKVIVQEFAMLFECGEQVKFRGYSLFYASNGAYKGNMLASNEHIEKLLADYVPLEELRLARERIEAFLQEKLQRRYCGFIGVDQFVAENGAHGSGKYCWNPAMEINLRITMGMVARNIYDLRSDEFNSSSGAYCFEPEKGIFKSV